MNMVQEKWDEILECVRTEHELSDISFNTWLVPLRVHDVDKNIVTIIVPSEPVRLSYVSKKYTLPLQVAIGEVTGMMDCEVHFILEKDAAAARIPSPQAAIHTTRGEEAGLNPKYTFDTFVVGNNNKFAHAASLAVSESPGEIYNPLFIYGGVGLGKTHLMHSIAHFILDANPESRVIYVTSEEFTNEVIESIRNKNNSAMAKFREKYRNVDVLLIDDVQFIVGRESTQEEFFHTFNTLHGAKKQIVLSSDRPPKDIETLEERIRSRFEWGLLADISVPDYETRMAILRKKEELDGYNAGDEVIKYIATNIKSNIRELEGALNKVMALAKLEGRVVNEALAEEVLMDMISPDKKRVITPQYITDVVAEHFDVSVDDIFSKKKNSKIAYPRQIIMYLCRHFTESNLQEIGKFLGKRNHTTVMHGIEKIEKELETSPTTQNTIQILEKKINPEK